MKYKDLIAKLTALGWTFKREGGSHEVWTDGKETIAVPRHREINDNLARAIIKKASGK